MTRDEVVRVLDALTGAHQLMAKLLISTHANKRCSPHTRLFPYAPCALLVSNAMPNDRVTVVF
jgi:hypothetical protein